MSKHLDIVWTNQFKKDYKLAMKRHLDIDLLDDIIRKLASSEQLPEKNKDHALTGNWVGHRECHIQPDWLLVYRIENDLLVLTLSRTGTHSDLFGKLENALGTNAGCIFLSAEMKKHPLSSKSNTASALQFHILFFLLRSFLLRLMVALLLQKLHLLRDGVLRVGILFDLKVKGKWMGQSHFSDRNLSVSSVSSLITFRYVIFA